MTRIAILVVAAGCGASGEPGTDGPPSDANGCRISIAISTQPNPPVAGPSTMVRANALLDNVPGVPTYSWAVSFANQPVTFTTEPPDNAAIDFTAPDAGVYHVTLDVAATVACDPALPADVNVPPPGANGADFRVRVTPPATATPPAQDRSIHISGGAPYSMGSVALDDGALRNGTVLAPGGGVPAYLRFSSVGTTTALIETFADMFGQYNVRLLGSAYDVVVIPAASGVAPQKFAGWLPGSALQLTTPATITGTVKDPTGALLAGAKVQLQIDGVPTTIGTTAANGTFSLLGHPAAGSVVEVEVAPPATSGLPRLVASSTFDLSVPMTINYASSVSVVNVAGVHVRRGGSPVPNAKVTVFGTMAGAGLVNSASANAAGQVRIAATANASGDLPAGTLAPRGVLSGVVDATGGLGVGAFDTTGAIPQAIDTNGPVGASSVVKDPSLAPIAGAVVDATPSGALAAAGGAVVHATTAANGSYALSLASGGHYALRIHDPSGRGAPLSLADVVAATVPSSSVLGKALQISGYILDGTSPIQDASVQILCNACGGIDASRPIAEIATGMSGGFSLAVPDPGTM